ncbi:NUDIX domain-containing protein [Patescibacteria group bacterium]|nr:NUDIX domain-containing protein [Patescibacteria group bacterium]
MGPEAPKVGIGGLVFRDGKILLGLRKGAHGEGTYGGPGGHLEHLESFEQCLKREAMEEAGIEIVNIRFLCITNFQNHAPKHYVDIGLMAEWKSGEPRVYEPDKCDGWGWYDLDDLPSPLFGVIPNYIKAYKSAFNFFDAF